MAHWGLALYLMLGARWCGLLPTLYQRNKPANKQLAYTFKPLAHTLIGCGPTNNACLRFPG